MALARQAGSGHRYAPRPGSLPLKSRDEEKSACPRQKQIGGITIDQGNTLDEQIVADEHRQKIEKEIAKLEKQARTEKQPKKKFELVQRVKALKKLIKELNGSEE